VKNDSIGSPSPAPGDRTAARSPEAADAALRRTWIAVAAAILGVFMSILDIQITNASLKEIFGSLSATQDEGSWMSTAYLAAEVTVIPLTTFFMTVFGLRNYMLANSVLFVIFSTLCGFAWNLESMIVFRMLQGLAGGGLIPMAMTLLLTRLPAEKRTTGLAWMMLSTTLAPAFGPTIGGILTGLYGWPSIFFINWVPGILMVLGLSYGLDRGVRKPEILRHADWLAIATMGTGLVSLIIFLEEGNTRDWFDSQFVQFFFVSAVVNLSIWIFLMLSRKNPFVNLGLFGRRNFGVSSVVGATTGMALYGSTFLLPLFLAQIAGYNSRQIGLVIMWMGLPQLVMMPIAAKFSKVYDNRIICSLGLLLFAMSSFMNTGMTADTMHDQLLASQILRGLGQPMIVLTLSNFATVRMEMHNMSSASSLFNMSRILGGAVGTAILATLLTLREKYHSVRLGESVSAFSDGVLSRIDLLSSVLSRDDADAAGTGSQALAAISNIVRRESFVMAYNDCFFVLSVVLVASVAVLWLSDRVVPGGGK
jgi:MFS transporter, DHA2 family, multidrug resistance protein